MLALRLTQELSSVGISVCALPLCKPKTDGRFAGAGVDADTAATGFVAMFAAGNGYLGGCFFDLFKGELP